MARRHQELKPRRRRLRLGRGGVVYLTVTLLILAAAIYTQANLLFWAFGLMVGGLTVSVMIALFSLRRVGVQRVLPSHGVVDEPMMLRYQIVNRSRVAVFGLMVYETWGKGRRGWKKVGPASKKTKRIGGRPFGWLLHLGPRQALQAEATCWPRRRGAIEFERIVLDSGFPFGVIHKVVEFEVPGEVLVYPKLWRINRRLLTTMSHPDTSSSRQSERGGGNEDFYGLRPYRPGDSLKLVDWRRTASSGQLVSRELTQPSPPRMMIVLDLRVDQENHIDESHYDDQCERAISLTSSLICDAYLNGYQIGLEVAGAGSEPFAIHHSLPHRTRMMDSLARLDTSALNRQGTMTDRPSVVIRPGKTGNVPSPITAMAQRPLILGAEELEEYVDIRSANSRDLMRRNPLEETRQMKVRKIRGASE